MSKNESSSEYKGYQEINESLRTHYLRQYEIPIEHFISFPLPTKRFKECSYAVFAAPAIRLPGQNLTLGAPDRWWLLNASDGRLSLYAKQEILPFGERLSSGRIEIDGDKDWEIQQELLKRIENLMEEASQKFFENEEVDLSKRKELTELLSVYYSKDVGFLLKSLAPDFFEYLEESNG